MTPQQLKECREAFEREYPMIAGTFNTVCPGRYIGARDQDRWEGWQACWQSIFNLYGESYDI